MVVRPEGFASRVAGAGWAVWFYLYKALLPVNLAFVYPRWEIDPASLLSYVPGLLLAGAFAALWRFRQSWGRPLLAGLGYFVVTLLPVLGFVRIYYMRYSLVADHWQYHALGGVIAVVVGTCFYPARGRGGIGKRAAAPAAGAVLVLCFGLTWRQAGIYADEQALWRDTLARNPSAWIAHNNLGLALNRQGRPQEAAEHFRAAIKLKPDHARAHSNLAAILEHQGDIEQALAHYAEALQIDRDNAKAHSNLGSLYARMGQYEKAIDHLSEAVRLEPEFAEAHSNLGNLLRMARRHDEAERCFAEALRLDPKLAEARMNFGILLLEQDRLDDAVIQFQEVIELRPESAMSHKLLGDAFARLNRIEQCVAHYRQAVKLKCDWAFVAARLAWILATYEDARLRNGTEAVALAERACRETGFKIPQALDTLAAAYAEVGRFDDAVKTAQTALDLARQARNSRLIEAIQRRMERYRTGNPYRETTQPAP